MTPYTVRGYRSGSVQKLTNSFKREIRTRGDLRSGWKKWDTPVE